MGVEVEVFESSPTLDYKYFFMERMEINQTRLDNSGLMPDFNMRITYRMYAVTPDGKWHYHNKVNSIIIDDYMQIAMLKAQEQDTDLLETAAVLEYAVAKIAEQTTGVGKTEVV